MQTFWIVLVAVVVAMNLLAVIKKQASIFQDKPEECNPMEGKKVKFVENVNEPENADGVRGYLEAVSSSEHKAGFYEKYVKRVLDIVLSICGLVILSSVFLVLSLWLLIDDPGSVLFIQKRIGCDKQCFKLHKFRSMKLTTPSNVPTHMLEHPEQWITRSGRFMRSHSLEGNDIIRQTTKSLINKGICEVNPSHFFKGCNLIFNDFNMIAA